MKLIKASFNIIEQGPSIDGIYKIIEQAGRVCYKSEDKITETSAREFVERMIKSGHGAMLEAGTIYLRYDFKAREDSNRVACNLWSKYKENIYSKAVQAQPILGVLDGFVAITTNYRVLVENNWLDDLQYICEPTEFHEKRYTVKFICDRGVSHEFVRHRVMSFAQESTRYCNYSKDKFGNEVTFIEPCWLEDYNYEGNTYYNGFLVALRAAEANYFDLMKKWEDRIPDKRYKTGFRNNPWTPQQARAVLPNALKTELVMTGFASDWEHFFKLRDAGSAHPQAYELAHPLHMEFLRRGYITDLYNEANPD
jgi:thymidylate synthase (FAD)